MTALRTKKLWATGQFSLVQSFYWAAFACINSYASTYLLSRGFTSGQIGLVLAVANGIAIFSQPIVTALIHRGIPLRVTVAVMTGIKGLVALLLLMADLPFGLIFGLYVCLSLMMRAEQPFVNAMGVETDAIAEVVDLGVARGVAMAAFALLSYLLGRWSEDYGTGSIMITCAVFSAALAVGSLLFRPVGREEKSTKKTTKPERTGRSSSRLLQKPYAVSRIPCGRNDGLYGTCGSGKLSCSGDFRAWRDFGGSWNGTVDPYPRRNSHALLFFKAD